MNFGARLCSRSIVVDSILNPWLKIYCIYVCILNPFRQCIFIVCSYFSSFVVNECLLVVQVEYLSIFFTHLLRRTSNACWEYSAGEADSKAFC